MFSWHGFSILRIKNMKSFLPLLTIMMMFVLTGCAVIGGIFKAGVWVGVLIVLFILGIIIWLVTRSSGKS
jgi:hypothetical protein